MSLDQMRSERLSTGSAALDGILGGGLPSRGVTVIAGEPGAGKTVLALQLLFQLAANGHKVMYVTTLSEPALKLLHHMQLFRFFDDRLLDDRMIFADIGSTLRAHGPEQALQDLAARVEEEEPSVIAVDSFKALHDLLEVATRSRSSIYEFAVAMASWGATTFLVGEYPLEEIGASPAFAIADGILHLTRERDGLSTVRQLEVLKLRGAEYAVGRHFFDITADGMTFYPRVRPPEPIDGSPDRTVEQVSLGVSGLDDVVHGGILSSSSTLVEGGTGTGKTLMGLHFLLQGARHGEPGVQFTLDETPDQLRMIGGRLGWDLGKLESQRLLDISYDSPVELSPDRFLYMARDRIRALGAKRAVLDSLTSLAMGISSERRVRELVYALTKHFRAAGVTLLMTMELPELTGSTQLTGFGVSSIADNVILLRHVEAEARLERTVSVLKVRGGDHETEPRQLTITPRGLEISRMHAQYRGVLSGLPVLAGPGSGSRRERKT